MVKADISVDRSSAQLYLAVCLPSAGPSVDSLQLREVSAIEMSISEMRCSVAI